MKQPAVDQAVVDWLESAFPAVAPDEADVSAESLLMETCRKQGEQRVIKHLRSLVTRQEHAALRTVL